MNAHTTIDTAEKAKAEEAKCYEAPVVKTLDQQDILQAVAKGSKFPARGFAG
ncbi:MAG: hypothetical protein QNJ44_00950 [Rhodobacter sp.]|nr:hypothetical protein [Rhodobacter sp.]